MQIFDPIPIPKIKVNFKQKNAFPEQFCIIRNFKSPWRQNYLLQFCLANGFFLKVSPTIPILEYYISFRVETVLENLYLETMENTSVIIEKHLAPRKKLRFSHCCAKESNSISQILNYCLYRWGNNVSIADYIKTNKS